MRMKAVHLTRRAASCSAASDLGSPFGCAVFPERKMAPKGGFFLRLSRRGRRKRTFVRPALTGADTGIIIGSEKLFLYRKHRRNHHAEIFPEAARAVRSGASRATAPRRLSGHVAGGVRKGEEAAPAPAALGAREAVRQRPKAGSSRQAGGMARWGRSRPNEKSRLRSGRPWRKAAFAGFGCRGSCSRAPLAENRPIGNSPQWDDSV